MNLLADERDVAELSPRSGARFVGSRAGSDEALGEKLEMDVELAPSLAVEAAPSPREAESGEERVQSVHDLRPAALPTAAGGR